MILRSSGSLNACRTSVDDHSQVEVDLYALVTALSEALGLVGGKIVDHGKRVAYLALSLGAELGLSSEDMADLRNAALLHDAGVSKTRTHAKLVQLDWEGALDHCRDGAALLKDFPPFDRIAEIILRHHDKWTKLTRSGTETRLAVLANLVFLADRIDVMIDWRKDVILNRDRIVGALGELSGAFFNPDAVDAFRRRADQEVFWLSLMPRHLPRALEKFRPDQTALLTLDDLETIAAVFGRIVDSKSPFTLHHSEGVSRLCDHFARSLGRDDQTRQQLRVAGLLHDLGKLAIPDEILEKPGPLSPDEFQIVKRHPFETYYILSGLPALTRIRDWAAYHHEKNDGSGYPFHLQHGQLQLEHVIVMFSDVVQALIQDRPYRSGLGRDNVLDILKHMAARDDAFEPFSRVVVQDYELIEQLAQGY
jgi:putative nucleotidyltransferase with HDIG domain